MLSGLSADKKDNASDSGNESEDMTPEILNNELHFVRHRPGSSGNHCRMLDEMSSTELSGVAGFSGKQFQ